MNIVETAINAGNFTKLVSAVQAASLVDTLSGEGPFTVFAPSDEAFSKLPEGTLDSLLQDVEKLKGILTYHVLTGKVMSSNLSGVSTATTVNGQEVTIDATNGVRVNNSNVVTADIDCSNGVIHVIDTVLLPQ